MFATLTKRKNVLLDCDIWRFQLWQIFIELENSIIHNGGMLSEIAGLLYLSQCSKQIPLNLIKLAIDQEVFKQTLNSNQWLARIEAVCQKIDKAEMLSVIIVW